MNSDQASLSDALSASSTHVAQVAAEFQWDNGKFEDGIGFAASGGGFRAMLFHAGALMRFNELGLLSQTKRFSSVSGGSIAIGYLACVWSKLKSDNFQNFRSTFVDPVVAFSKKKIDVVDALTGALPWTSAAEQVAHSYDDYLFAGKTLQDLPDQPRFVFCATNLQTGVLWRFSKPYAGDYVLGRLDQPTLRLALAVAASSAFPPVLSPLCLQLPEGSFKSWETGPGPFPEAKLAEFRKRILLTDGGVYDNHGIEPIIKRYTTAFVSDGGAPFIRNSELNTDWISQLRRVLDISDNQVRALRRRDLIDRFVAGNQIGDPAKVFAEHAYARMGAYWGIDTDVNKLNPNGALPSNSTITQTLAEVPTRLSDLGTQTSKQLVNWGYAISDRSIRANYRGALSSVKADWPYPDAGLA
jgi:NTE family protein